MDLLSGIVGWQLLNVLPLPLPQTPELYAARLSERFNRHSVKMQSCFCFLQDKYRTSAWLSRELLGREKQQ